MKILLLPNNIASMTAITVDALNEAGHEAKGLILQGDIKQSHRNLKVFNYDKKNPFKVFTFLKWYFYFLKYVLWADVIHWNGSFSIPLLKITLPVIKFLKKPALVEFVGSDIRNPEIEFLDNPYFEKMILTGLYEYHESAEYSKQTQLQFSFADFGVIVFPGMEQHINKDLLKRCYKGFQRILTSEFTPQFPSINNPNPIIIHYPSAPIAKGTNTIIKAIDNLKQKFNFEFKLVQNLPHSEAISILGNADIVIDQLNGGHYGMTSLEAMSFGKPTVCFIKDYVLKNNLPTEIPVIIATHDNLESKIEELILSPELRNRIGIKGRTYVMKYHDAIVESKNLINIYRKEINLKKNEHKFRKV